MSEDGNDKSIFYGLVILFGWLVFIFFQIWALYLVVFDAAYWLKNGYWYDHGSVLEWLERDENVFTEWIGARKILNSLPVLPWAGRSLLGFIVFWFLRKAIEEYHQE